MVTEVGGHLVEDRCRIFALVVGALKFLGDSLGGAHELLGEELS